MFRELVDEIDVPEVVYLIVHKKGVQTEDGKPIITDPSRVYARTIIERGVSKPALPIYFKKTLARRFVGRKKTKTPRITWAAFRSLSEFLAFLEQSKIKWILFNHFPKENNGYKIKVKWFINQARKGMADGEEGSC